MQEGSRQVRLQEQAAATLPGFFSARQRLEEAIRNGGSRMDCWLGLVSTVWGRSEQGGGTHTGNH